MVNCGFRMISVKPRNKGITNNLFKRDLENQSMCESIHKIKGKQQSNFTGNTCNINEDGMGYPTEL